MAQGTSSGEIVEDLAKKAKRVDKLSRKQSYSQVKFDEQVNDSSDDDETSEVDAFLRSDDEDEEHEDHEENSSVRYRFFFLF